MERQRPAGRDVVVTTSYKAGATFTQTILLSLIHGSIVDYPKLEEISPWIDCRPVATPLEDIYAALAAETRQRFIKSHLAPALFR